MDKLASRRFIISVLVILINTLMMYNGFIDKENFEAIMIWVSGIYIVGKPAGDAMTSYIASAKD